MQIASAIEEARALARSHLHMIGGMYDSPTDTMAVARALGIIVVSKPCWISPKFTGSSFVGSDGFRLIVVNSLLPAGRWAFTVAHEIAHIAMGHLPPRSYQHEYLANKYASELLMPLPRVRRQLQQWGEDIHYLAHINGVSFSAMHLRIQEIASLVP